MLPSHLLKTPSGVFYFRQSVPNELRPLLNKREIKFSLGTRCPQTAKWLSYSYSAKVWLVINQLKTMAKQSDKDNDIWALVSSLQGNEVRKFELGTHPNGYPFIKQAQPGEDWDNAQVALKQAKESLEDIGVIDFSQTPKKAPVGLPAVSFSEAIKAFKITKKSDGIAPKTIQMMTTSLKNLADFLDKPETIQSVTRTDMAAYAQHLAANGKKKATMKRVFSGFCTFFDHMIDTEKYVGENPARNIVRYTAKQKKSSEKYANQPYTKSELQKIFITIQYRKKFAHTYYIPWLALFTGARVRELGQLHCSDIIEKNGLWCLYINEESSAEQSLKTESSHRLIPLPKQLIDRGLLDYKKEIEAEGNSWLFPNLKNNANGRGSTVSNKFCDKVKKLGIEPAVGNKTFHSLRKTLIQHLQDYPNILDSYRMGYVGHEADVVHYQSYTKKIPPEKLAEVIFPALESLID